MKAFKAFIKPFKAPQGSVKIKISVYFFCSSGIEAGRVNINYLFLYVKMGSAHNKILLYFLEVCWFLVLRKN